MTKPVENGNDDVTNRIVINQLRGQLALPFLNHSAPLFRPPGLIRRSFPNGQTAAPGMYAEEPNSQAKPQGDLFWMPL